MEELIPGLIARKQKKAQDWEKALQDFTVADSVKSELQASLTRYKALLSSFWLTPSEETMGSIQSLESDLNSLFSEARFCKG
jgi:hypothetical protein